MSRIQRVVIDTSTLVGAALHIGSIPHQALLKALRFCNVCTSTETLARNSLPIYAEERASSSYKMPE